MNRYLSCFVLLIPNVIISATYHFSTSGNNTTGLGTEGSPFYSLCGPGPGSTATTGPSRLATGLNGSYTPPNQIILQPGDHLLFKRGDIWEGLDAYWHIGRYQGIEGNPITIGAYGVKLIDAEGTDINRPLFRGAYTAAQLGISTWNQYAGNSNIFYADGVDWSPQVVAQEDPDNPTGRSPLPLWGSRSLTGTFSSNQDADVAMKRGTHYYSAPANRLYVWRLDGLKPDDTAGRKTWLGRDFDGTGRICKIQKQAGLEGTGVFIIKDIHCQLSSSYGFVASYPHISFLNCLSELNGKEGFIFDRGRWNSASRGDNGSLFQSISRRNNIQAEDLAGQNITVESMNVTIDSCDIYESGWAGVDFLEGSPVEANNTAQTEGGVVKNCRIWANAIHPCRGRNFDPGIYVDGGAEIFIYNNHIWNTGIDPRGVKWNNNSGIRHRTFGNPGISVDIEAGGYLNGRRVSKVKIVNNLIYGNAGAGVSIGGINGTFPSPSNCTTGNCGGEELISNIMIIGNTIHRHMGETNIIDTNGDPDIIPRPITIRTGVSSGVVVKNNIILNLNTSRAPLFVGKEDMDSGAYAYSHNVFYSDFSEANYDVTGSYGKQGFITYFVSGFANNTLGFWRGSPYFLDTNFTTSFLKINPLVRSTNVAAFDAHLLDGSSMRDVADTNAYATDYIGGIVLQGSTKEDGTADIPYNDLGYHYPLIQTLPSNVLRLTTTNQSATQIQTNGFQFILLYDRPGEFILEYSRTLEQWEPFRLVNAQMFPFAIQQQADPDYSFFRARSARIPNTAPDIIIDNSDIAHVALSSGWTSSVSLPGYYGTNYFHNGKQEGLFIRYSPNIPKRGIYNVHLRWLHFLDRATNVPVYVFHAEGTNIYYVNQTLAGTNWNYKGTFLFNAGTNGAVEIRTDGTGIDKYVTADAVGFSER